jgi:NAD(P)-dependent dehydrogenase (short-subunit alcohol dehydrogenase family)
MADRNQDFEGRVALVTGGASGIGRATCKVLADRGAKVIVADINTNGGWESVERIGANAAFAHLDVTDEASWCRCIDFAIAKEGHLDVLANIAGIGIGGDVENLSLADWDRLFAVNSTGPFLGCKHAIRAMGPSGRPGSIINVASLAAVLGTADLVGYCASKGSVRMLTKSVALYCAFKGYPIRCNSVNPTYVDTEMLDPIAEMYGGRSAMVAAMSKLVPAGRLCTPEEIAETIAFLASDSAAMITGGEINIDGGQTAGVPPSHFV